MRSPLLAVVAATTLTTSLALTAQTVAGAHTGTITHSVA